MTEKSSVPPKILAIGGAHVDRRGQVDGAFVPGASNPVTLTEEIGGGAFNAIRHLAARGFPASVLSVRGGDIAGESVARAIADAGVTDLSAVFLDRATPSYTALLDHGGELIAGFADMGLYEVAFPRQVARAKTREAIEGASAVLIDANLPAAAIEAIAGLAGDRPLFAIAISPAKAPRLAQVLGRLTCLYANRREAAALTGLRAEAGGEALVDALRAKGLTRGTVSGGGGGLIAFEGDRLWRATPPEPERIVDVTGAGDALAGHMTAALIGGETFPAALQQGLAAALLTIESPRVVPALDKSGLAAALGRTLPPVPLQR